MSLLTVNTGSSSMRLGLYDHDNLPGEGALSPDARHKNDNPILPILDTVHVPGAGGDGDIRAAGMPYLLRKSGSHSLQPTLSAAAVAQQR